jgi:hypothetical protein
MSPLLAAYTLFHVLLSLAGIFSGFVVVYGLLAGHSLPTWTSVFLVTTVATSVTGFFFPAHHLLPSHIVGIISLAVLAGTIYARYRRKLVGRWNKVYVIGAVLALYLNFFVAIVQAFMKVPALKTLAPTQSEPPFKVTQVFTLAVFVVIGVVAAIRFRSEPAPAPLPT